MSGYRAADLAFLIDDNGDIVGYINGQGQERGLAGSGPLVPDPRANRNVVAAGFGVAYPTAVLMGDSITAGGNHNLNAGVTLTGSGFTATCNATAHGLQVGNPVFITGCAEQAFNGTFIVASTPTANQFTYTATQTLPAAATASTINGVLAAIQVLNPLRRNDRHFFEMANAQIGRPIGRVVNVAGSGQGSAHMLARFSRDVLAFNPQLVGLMSCGINSVAASIPAVSILSDITGMAQQALTAGAAVLIGTLTPRGSMTATQIQIRFAVNAGIRRYAAITPGVHLVDFDACTVDFASATADWLATYNIDSTHPNGLGARVMSNTALKPVLQQLFPQTVKRLDVTNIQDSYAVDNTAKQLIVNPLMTGTAGTVAGTVTGNAPTSWTITNSSGPTTAGAAQTARSDGVGYDYQLTISGATSGSVDLLGTDVSGIAAGDQLVFSLNVQGASQANITAIEAWMDIIVAGVTYNIDLMLPNGNGGSQAAFDWVLKTDETFVVPAGSITNFRPRLKIICGSNPAGVFKIGAVALRKLN